MKRKILVDLPNTLLDSRHRTKDIGIALTNIKNDTVSYSALKLLKDLMKLDYTIVYTHYCLSRLTPVIETFIKKKKLPEGSLYTNFATSEVYDSNSLKKYVYEHFFKDEIDYVIDNDESMLTYWLSKDISLINVPLGLVYEYSDNRD